VYKALTKFAIDQDIDSARHALMVNLLTEVFRNSMTGTTPEDNEAILAKGISMLDKAVALAKSVNARLASRPSADDFTAAVIG
jgi:hypothetical protein